jgi:hypothetical protein
VGWEWHPRGPLILHEQKDLIDFTAFAALLRYWGPSSSVRLVHTSSSQCLDMSVTPISIVAGRRRADRPSRFLVLHARHDAGDVKRPRGSKRIISSTEMHGPAK